MDQNLPQFHITDESPRLRFDYPILWNAVKLLQDSAGLSYAYATAMDPLNNKAVFVSGSPGEVVPMTRLFLSTQNGWQLVTNKGTVFAARCAAEPSNRQPEAFE